LKFFCGGKDLALSPEGPSDACRAPLRAAGAPLSARRRGREEEEESGAARAWKRQHDEQQQQQRNDDEEEDDEPRAGPGLRAQVAEARVFAPRRAFAFAAPGGSFSGAQVAAMVAGAVRDRERELREEYDELLAERLDEQWRAFARFSEEQLRHQLASSRHDYFS
jgi:hypothetical protein